MHGEIIINTPNIRLRPTTHSINYPTSTTFFTQPEPQYSIKTTTKNTHTSSNDTNVTTQGQKLGCTKPKFNPPLSAEICTVFSPNPRKNGDSCQLSRREQRINGGTLKRSDLQREIDSPCGYPPHDRVLTMASLETVTPSQLISHETCVTDGPLPLTQEPPKI